MEKKDWSDLSFYFHPNTYKKMKKYSSEKEARNCLDILLEYSRKKIFYLNNNLFKLKIILKILKLIIKIKSEKKKSQETLFDEEEQNLFFPEINSKLNK